MFRRLLGRIALVLVAVAGAVVTGVLPAHAAEAVCTTTKVDIGRGVLIDFGGRRLCDYRVRALSEGPWIEVFVVGTNHGVYTRWWAPVPGLGAWVSLGGVVKTGDYRSIDSSYTGDGRARIMVVGTNGTWYHKIGWRTSWPAAWSAGR